MSYAFEVASTETEAREIAALHDEVAAHHRAAVAGSRPWRAPSASRVLASLAADGTCVTIVAREEGARSRQVVASLRLDSAKGFCGVAPFTEVARFVYLAEMAVHPSHQRRGLGRRCLAEAEGWARAHAASAIRTDTNDDRVGAAAFYVACGYREVLRYAQTIYLERLL